MNDKLMSNFLDLGLGWSDDLQLLPQEQAETLYEELAQAQADGKLDLETDEGPKNLAKIIQKYFI